jgi:hypothetical protein
VPVQTTFPTTLPPGKGPSLSSVLHGQAHKFRTHSNWHGLPCSNQQVRGSNCRLARKLCAANAATFLQWTATWHYCLSDTDVYQERLLLITRFKYPQHGRLWVRDSFQSLSIGMDWTANCLLVQVLTCTLLMSRLALVQRMRRGNLHPTSCPRPWRRSPSACRQAPNFDSKQACHAWRQRQPGLLSLNN